MKGINARTALISLFLGLPVATQGQAKEYDVYQTPNGALVISNKQPPPGSKTIKKLNLAEDEQAHEPVNTQPNGQLESSSKTARTSRQ